MMKQVYLYFSMALLVVLVALLLSPASALLTLFLYFLFITIISFSHITRRAELEHVLTMYSIVFIANLAYVLLCQKYMQNHNYNFLLYYDTIDVFLPNTQDYINYNSNLFAALKDIWGGYSIFNRFQAGYYTILTLLGFLAKLFEADLYYSIQLGSLAICSLLPIVLYRILRLQNVSCKDSRSYSIIISLCSVSFIFSNVILRDGMIALLIIYLIYLCLKEISTINMVKIVAVIVTIITFRVETGLVCVIFIPFYLWNNRKQLQRFVFISLISLCIIIALLWILWTNNTIITSLLHDNYNWYSAHVDEGAGMIARFQRLPPIISDVFSVIYTFLQPLPCWLRMDPSYNITLPECYNIMNFPNVFSAFFNFYVFVFAIFYLCNSDKSVKNSRNLIGKSFGWMLIPVCIFLFVQSSVVEQRRILGAYLFLYIMWALVHHSQNSRWNRRILIVSVFGFLVLQIFANLYLL